MFSQRKLSCLAEHILALNMLSPYIIPLDFKQREKPYAVRLRKHKKYNAGNLSLRYFLIVAYEFKKYQNMTCPRPQPFYSTTYKRVEFLFMSYRCWLSMTWIDDNIILKELINLFDALINDLRI
jgi:hypothetical protein